MAFDSGDAGDNPCPKCGSEDVVSGYGCDVGPSIGTYVMCLACGHVLKFTPDNG